MQRIKIAVLSNTNIESIKHLAGESIELFIPHGYGAWEQELLNQQADLYRFKPQIVFVLMDGYELFMKLGSQQETVISDYEEIFDKTAMVNPEIMFFISDIDVYSKKILPQHQVFSQKLFESRWSEMLKRLVRSTMNIINFDLKQIVEYNGRKEIYSAKYWYLSSSKYSLEGFKLIVDELKIYIKAFLGIKKKLLVLDLDNTLWGGLAGEDGPYGIELNEYGNGARFKDFQKRIKELKDLGVILAICSKNNLDDVSQIFENNSQMVLKWDDFASKRINWENKAENIISITKELNIGYDSAVFVDDSAHERSIIKNILPEVEVIDFPEDTSRLEEMICKVYKEHFFTLRTTKEDTQKTELYIQESKRKDHLSHSTDLTSFLKSLQTRIVLYKIREDYIIRAAQLAQKTNQFNCTTKRYTESDIKAMTGDPAYLCFIADISDKFGDSGLTAMVIVKLLNSFEAEIDTFLMSCRIMSRSIEDMVIDCVEEILYKKGIKELYSEYTRTEKNIPVEYFYDRLGYILMNDDGRVKRYVLKIEEKPARKRFGKMEVVWN